MLSPRPKTRRRILETKLPTWSLSFGNYLHPSALLIYEGAVSGFLTNLT